MRTLFQSAVVRTAALMLILAALAAPALADGSETLGVPSIPIASGSGYIAKGVGLALAQPGTIALTVPSGATIRQVLLYWEGQHTTPAGDNTIIADGIPVTGTLIGGPNYFFGSPAVYSSTYRADVTALNLVSVGANAVVVEGLSFSRVNNGAGLLVIYDDGAVHSDIQLRDGNDLAYRLFPEPRASTVAQTFTFDPAPMARTASLSLFFSSVQGVSSTGGPQRPNRITVTIGAVATDFDDVLSSLDGEEWDTWRQTVTIPAGIGEVTIQAVSGPGGDDDPNTPVPRPASFAWIAAGFSVPCVGTIGNFVWRDANCDGVQGVGETGIPGVTVRLYDSANNLLDTTVTDAGGYYLFTGLCAGGYSVGVDASTLPPGLTPTTCSNAAGVANNSNCSPSPVVLDTDASEDLTIDFGYCEECHGKIGNFIWKDADCDGLQDYGEHGISGVVVRLLNAAGAVIAADTTNCSGYYLFCGLCPGEYAVVVDSTTLPTDYFPTECDNAPGVANNSNCSPAPVVLGTGTAEDKTIDFGFCRTVCLAKIGNFVWKDRDCDGVQDPGEQGIRNVTVRLLNASGALVRTAVTDCNGYYLFRNLCAGEYTVQIVTSTLPPGYTATICSNAPLVANNSNCSPSPVVLTGGAVQNLTIDFGFCEEQGGQGCTPGYWKQCHHFDSWPSPYRPSTRFGTVFENAFPGKTLLQVLQLGGGGLNALGRHAVAALLNAKSGGVDYDMTPEQVISAFNNVYPGSGSDYETLKDLFEDYNEQGCPLHRTIAPAEQAPTTAARLFQNYPNPFNPSTEVSFELAEHSFVRVRVFNLLGQEVITLAEGEFEAGTHVLTWDAIDQTGTAVTSGVYFCQLQTGSAAQIIKMSLMR